MFALPFARRMPSLPVPMLNFQNVLIAIAFFSMARDRRKEGEKKARVPHLVPILVLGLLITVSYVQMVLTFVPVYSRKLWDPYKIDVQFKSVIYCLLLYIFAAMAIRSREDVAAALKAGIAGMIVEAMYITLEYLVLSPGRATGHLAEPNNAGVFLACSFNLMLAFLLLLPKGDRRKRILVVGLAFTAVSLVGTLSRGGWGGCLLAFVFLTAITNRKVLAAGLLVLAMGSYWVPKSVVNRLDASVVDEKDTLVIFRDGRVDGESPVLDFINDYLERKAREEGLGDEKVRLDPSMQERIIVWTVAVKMMADYPLGVGYGVFPFHVVEYSNVLWYKASHNIYLKTGAESGIPALLALLYLIVALFRDAVRVYRKETDPAARALGIGAAAYLLALAMGAMMIDIFFQVEVNGQFWMLMAMVCRVPSLAAEKAEEPQPAVPAEPSPSAPKPLYELVR
ncbi:MAG TPA: O-antigen ligase family protein, partial [Candidatus Saccharimonadales bacterium]|nr:O-antigen ligase family protein [Candidatus Saccharimonadales bacterium]